ncbi:MAG TPA: hypothetical protein VFZ66_06260 [Herpetosiphonaceae bacterium]
MYAALRWYNVEPGLVNEMARRVNEGFVPIIRTGPGFVAYYLINAGNSVVVTVSVFEDRAGAEASHDMAADWVARNLISVILGPPTMTAGEVLVQSIGGQ